MANAPPQETVPGPLERALFAGVLDAILVADDDGRYVEANPAACEMFGVSHEELIGRNLADFAEPGFDVDTAWSEFRRQGRVQGEFRLLRKDGSVRDLQFSATADIVPGRHVSVLRDVTEAKRAVSVLRQSEERLRRQNRILAELAGTRLGETRGLAAALRTLMEEAAHTLEVERASVWLYDQPRTSIGCAEIYELSLNRHSSGTRLQASRYPVYFEAIETERTIDAHDARTDPRTIEFLDDYLTPLGIRSMLDAPIRARGRTMGIVCFEHVGQPRHWAPEEQVFAASIADYASLAVEIAERERAELALSESEERRRALFNQMAVGIAETDLTGKLLSVNARFAEILGTPAAALEGRTFADITFHEDRQASLEAFLRLVETGESFSLEKRYLGSDGAAVIWARTSAALVRDGAGRPRFVAAVMQDISEAKAFESELLARATELARSNAELERFAYVASHDLQEPLRNVTTHSQLLASRLGSELDGETRDILETIVSGAHTMQSLVEGLLAYSLVDRRPRLQQLRAEEALDEAVAHLEDRVAESDARIEWDDLPVVEVDRLELVQCFQALLSNAIKFRRGAGPRIRVECEAMKGTWMFSVHDDGVGIQADQRERIFGLFQRGHPRRYPGTGVGLAICRKIVESRGGRIWVESPPGGGSIFRFTLPRP